MSKTNRNINYPGCEAKNCWRCIDAHSGDAAGSMSLFLSLWRVPIYRLCITATKLLFTYHTYKTTNVWHSIDAHFDVLSIQHLLPSIIVFIMIWTYWYSVWLIEAWPCAKARRSNFLALFALTRLKFMYLAKTFIAPSMHLFNNQYWQATAHSLPMIYY